MPHVLDRLQAGIDYLFDLEQQGKMGSQEYRQWLPEWERLLAQYEQEPPKPASQGSLDLSTVGG